MKSRENLLDDARQNIPEMTVREVHDYMKEGNDPVLLDVRGLDEWERGHLKDLYTFRAVNWNPGLKRQCPTNRAK